ncbi:MAG: hypothetical protein HRT47_13100 [Candidatus Caenarcaniphilales bacterium]|nr:hypothetical protein [Candidatus Caenarcaniphilales bacterium]
MNIELYIFNKESKKFPGFTNWEANNAGNSKSYKLDIVSDKFKSKNLNSDFVKDLNAFLKRSEQLTSFFKSFDYSINLEFTSNLSHILFFEVSKQTLYIDADVKNEFIPFYCFAFYYAALRKSKDQDYIFNKFYDFFLAVDSTDIKKLINFLEADKTTTKLFDAGANILKFLKQILNTEQDFNELDKFKISQVIRNRTLTGSHIYDIDAIEKTYENNLADPFSGQACDDLYQSLVTNHIPENTESYFQTLNLALEALGMNLIAQRGSRVAHEQGPILINSGILNNSASLKDKLEQIIKDIKNSVNKFLDDLNSNFPDLFQEQCVTETKLDMSLVVDELNYLLSMETVPKAKIAKTANHIKKINNKVSSELKSLNCERNKSKSLYSKLLESLINFEKEILLCLFELEELSSKSPGLKKKSVVYIQRLSQRSGHIIARIILGENLYVETDSNSLKHRIRAIPFTFVSPDFDHTAGIVNSFFENASISIVTDPDTGTPSIKWQNAEDLAFSMAPSLFKAIQIADQKGKNFHYQLETTLFGPLIEKFRNLLEEEISIYASAELLSKDLITERKTEYTKIIENAAEIILSIYQLKSEFELNVIVNKVDKLSAILELIQSYRDAKQDIAALCITQKNNLDNFNELKSLSDSLFANETNSQTRLNNFKERLYQLVSSDEAKEFARTKLSYLDTYIIKDLLKEQNLENRYSVSSRKNIDADFHFLFTVAPSRIDFGKNVVASITDLMGRMLGGDDYESLQIGKDYIDLVSQTDNSLFNSCSEAGSAKVIENTCRALQYSKAISFQGVFQSFDIDGYLVRDTINSRDNSKVGIHIMEQGTMASTGYCITKEPLFILHALKENYEGNEYSAFSAELIKHARVINESGIFQRIELMNEAISAANDKKNIDKEYSEIRIALNASYKGNVSDERENANQYLMALLLKQKKFIKNLSLDEVKNFYQKQIDNHEYPLEIRVFDPFVDPDIFMSGELKEISLNCIDRLVNIFSSLENPLDYELIEACMLNYGSDFRRWKVLNKRLATYDENFIDDLYLRLDQLKPELKYLETFTKGFYKDPYMAYQSCDVIQLNSDHKELIELTDKLVELRLLMEINNPDSLLVLIDNPQQAKKPFLDYDATREWFALGGTVASHMVSSNKYQEWAREVEQEKNWAKLHIQKLLGQELDEEQEKLYQQVLEKNFEFIDLKRDLLKQKYFSAKTTSVSKKRLERYEHSLKTLSKLSQKKEIFDDFKNLDFDSWLVLGGRWVLNGEKAQNISFIKNQFKDINAKSLDLYVTEEKAIAINTQSRLIKQSGSTKEADLLVLNAAESISFREEQEKENLYKVLKINLIENQLNKHSSIKDPESLVQISSGTFELYIKNYNASLESKYQAWSELSAIILLYENFLSSIDSKFCHDLKNLVYSKDEFEQKESFEVIFGDHQENQGSLKNLAAQLKSKLPDNGLDFLNSLIELLIFNQLIALTVNCQDENIMINQLGSFFDLYLNIHEEDYPPYVYHKLCAGTVYGFDVDYFNENSARERMFKLSFSTGQNIYKLLHKLISKKTILNLCSSSYRDSLIGDYENGIIPLCYQHQTICIEERFWDCMKALRNFIRNYHDRHPLPLIIKGESANSQTLFGDGETNTKTIYIVGLSSIGKHSWDLPLVLRSPVFRDAKIDANTKMNFSTVTCFAPHLTEDGHLKQIYTSFNPEYLEANNVKYLPPFENSDNPYELNQYGFAHALINFESETELPKPNIIMAAHTHPQYVSGFTASLQIPEVWSYLNMLQMYSKTELTQILDLASISSLKQINFTQGQFNSKAEINEYLKSEFKKHNCKYVEDWLLKSSKESGGRGISNVLNIHRDFDEIANFIIEKGQADDIVMQEFVPNNAKAFIETEFLDEIKEVFVESGIALNTEKPSPDLFFTMRSFQSISGIKGYLFSANAANVTVNAGQGAKLFYGEPIFIMPPYFANKVQHLLDNYGDTLLKKAIPEHAKIFAIKNKVDIYEHPGNISNIFMLNGLFDYIPYLYVTREIDLDGEMIEQNFKVHCIENCFGGLDYFYNFRGVKELLISERTHADSLLAIENLIKEIKSETNTRAEKNIDLELAVIELNSGLGQANLLQKALDQASEKFGEDRIERFMFDEWVSDLEQVALINMQHKD